MTFTSWAFIFRSRNTNEDLLPYEIATHAINPAVCAVSRSRHNWISRLSQCLWWTLLRLSWFHEQFISEHNWSQFHYNVIPLCLWVNEKWDEVWNTVSQMIWSYENWLKRESLFCSNQPYLYCEPRYRKSLRAFTLKMDSSRSVVIWNAYLYDVLAFVLWCSYSKLEVFLPFILPSFLKE